MGDPAIEQMHFGSGISQINGAEEAVREAIENARKSLDHASVDLAFVFFSPHYGDGIQKIQQILLEELSPKVLLGCAASGIIGVNRELEDVSAISLFVAHLPAVRLHPFYLGQREFEGMDSPQAIRGFFGISPEDSASFILLPDPFTFDIVSFLKLMEQAYTGCPVAGGLASGAMVPGQNILLLNGERVREGMVGVVVSGNVEIHMLVSQGCRPFGEPLIVTSADQNVIHELAGRSAMDMLRETFLKASKHDQALAQRSLFVGCVVDEYKQKLERGDFVIRNVIAADPDAGTLTIGDFVDVGQTIQFHVRDAASAHDDLQLLCRNMKKNQSGAAPRGALMFCCNGRGQHMFEQANHDVSTLHQSMGVCPTAGFFCAGELGPIGRRNFLHGFTSSIALFYPKEKQFL